MQIQKKNLTLCPPDKLSFSYVIGSPMICVLILENQSAQKLHFKIISTLCKQLTPTPDHGTIQPGQSSAVELQLVHEHNVQYNLEKIAVISSNRPFLYGYVVDSAAEKDVLSVEATNLPQQTNIRPEFIRINESVAFKTKGNQLYKEGNYEAALEKYQQAIAIYRYDVRYYSNEVLALNKMKRYEDASKIIEKILLFDPLNPKVLSSKAVLFAELSKLQESQGNKLFLLKEAHSILQTAKKHPSKNITVQSIQEIINKIKVLQSRVGHLNNQDFAEYLLNHGQLKKQQELAKNGFENLFKNTEEFSLYLKQAVSLRDLDTPEYILDPLSYQILKRPIILPSGISYDQPVIKEFVQKKGAIDPIAKIPLNLNLLFPNHNLQNFIKNSEELATWRQTEAQILHANDNDIEF